MDTLFRPIDPGVQTPQKADGRDRGIGRVETHFKGKHLVVPAAQIEQRTVITTGKWLKIAAVRDEELIEGDTVEDPGRFIPLLKESGLNADLFTFGQRVPYISAKYNYCTEWENAAAIPITDFSHWWKECAEYSIRKAVNRAKKLGVVVRVAEFDEKLIEGICHIYNETSVRQGKLFWHYKKDVQLVKRELATYLDRSVFIGTYYENELVGFMKITWVGTTGTITQILSLTKHFDKRPNNAMIAKAVEICASEGKSHFIYGSYVYQDPNSSLTQFKRRNGFEAVPLPRYYIPLTLKGRVALQLGLHRGLAANTPKPVMRVFLKARKFCFEYKLKRGASSL
jgi:hypothetical protein